MIEYVYLRQASHNHHIIRAEMKVQGMENSVTVVQGSEFGRTITPNTNGGTDHAWGGNVSATTGLCVFVVVHRIC